MIDSFSALSSITLFFFVLGYLAIIFEHAIKVNKATSAILMAVVLWALQFTHPDFVQVAGGELNTHLANISQVILFLLGALIIVEIIHAHGGLEIVSRLMKVRSKRAALWIIGFAAFFLSSIMDNLTTTIVMVMMLKKIVINRDDRLLFGSVVVIAANAGGVWTPIGDVTTTMLWVGGQLTTKGMMASLILPSIICLIAALLCMMPQLKGYLDIDENSVSDQGQPKGKTILICGIASLIFVPVFKAITGLPPFMGILFSMSAMWVLTDLLHSRHPDRDHLRVAAILPRVDISGILFFLGILLAVGALEAAGVLTQLAQQLDRAIPHKETIAVVIGALSAIVDNVPLVAACMGMYNASAYPTDSSFWQLIAYCAGTGGSMLIIGSAAGVAFMGLEKVDFFWYLRKAGLASLVGYLAGIVMYTLQSYV